MLFVRYIIICLIWCPLFVKSQDLIILKNGTDTIKCRILGKTEMFLKFRYNNADTNVYEINRNRIDRFVLKEPQNFISDTLNIYNTSNNAANHSRNIASSNIGLGVGIDYGGAGVRYTLVPMPYFALFIGLGYNIVGVGENLGLTLRVMPKKVICPNFSIMYGYNTSFVVENLKRHSKMYFGPTVSIGFEVKPKKMKNYLNFEMLFPFRSDKVLNDANTSMHEPYIVLKSEPADQLFAIGYHFVFK